MIIDLMCIRMIMILGEPSSQINLLTKRKRRHLFCNNNHFGSSTYVSIYIYIYIASQPFKVEEMTYIYHLPGPILGYGQKCKSNTFIY